MQLEEIPEGLRCEYQKECPCCSLITKVLTQRDNDPEYLAEVYVMCTCGEYLEFLLPVN